MVNGQKNIHVDTYPGTFKLAGSSPYPDIHTRHEASIFISAVQTVTY
jgi:hypothetical protein